MRCKRCNKEIDEYEIFCDDCKKILKEESSKKELNELENLIEENQKLNDLEVTKELETLSNLSILEQVKIDEKNKLEDTKDLELEEFIEIENPKKNKIIIILCIIISILIIGIVIFFAFFNKPKQIVKEEKIDYEKIINEYGNEVVKVTKKYISDNQTIPTWKNVLENLSYKKYDVLCSVHEIYDDGSIYLEKCTVDNNNIDYLYGYKKEELKEEGKKIEIYKSKKDFNHYSDVKYNDDYELISTVNCETKSCDYINGYDNYVLIRENNQYYLYDYVNNIMSFGPFNLVNEYTDVLSYNSILYGILYKDQDKSNLYNIKTNKILKDIKGSVEESGMYYEPNMLLKYNLLVLKNENKYNFVNINTGNISFTLNENIREFIEYPNKKIVYILTYTSSNNIFKIYNSNGKLLFNGKEYNYINISNNIIVSTLTNFEVYDPNLNLKVLSKEHDKIMGIYKDFVVSIDNNKLKIIDLNDKEITAFDFDLESENYTFHSMLSGYRENEICLVFENNNIPYGTEGSGIEYCYNKISKESKIIKTEGIGGY